MDTYLHPSVEAALADDGPLPALRTRPAWTPEQELWGAVLQDAIACANRPQRFDGRRVRDAARQWLAADDTEIGGFRWVCDVLGLEVESVRQAARRAAETPTILVASPPFGATGVEGVRATESA